MQIIQVSIHNVTCPESTTTAAPATDDLDQFNLTLARIGLVIPDGHAGLTGIAFGYGGNAVVPVNTGAYFSGNDESLWLDLYGYPDGVPWTVWMINNDLQPHSWQVRCQYIALAGPTTATITQPISTADIYAAANTNIGAGP